MTGGDSGSKLVMKGSSVRVRASAFFSFPGSFVGQGNARAALTTLLSGSRVRDGCVRDPFSVGEVVRSRWCGSVDLQGVLHLRDSLEGQVCLPASAREWTPEPIVLGRNAFRYPGPVVRLIETR